MKTTLYLAGCVWQLLCMATSSFGDYTVVNSKFGRLRGSVGFSSGIFDAETVTYARFHGVPYAEPPIGKRRFMPPVKRSTRWHGTMDARQPGPICPQLVTEETVMEESEIEFTEEMVLPTDANLVTVLPPLEGMDEDCLTLDIIVPIVVNQITTLEELPQLPVTVWFHGGDYLRGSSSDQDGSILVSKTGAIIVKVNYRLGVFGFLSTGINTLVSGNAGLFDQQLALKWIQENIRDFGGDPERVTIFGEGAGSESVSLHLFINDSQPFFQRAIIQNDLNFPWNLPGSLNPNVRDFAVRTGCDQRQGPFNPANAIECLQSLSVNELLSATEMHSNAIWGPVKDDKLFKVGETEYFIGSHDIIIGVTSWSDVNTILPYLQKDSLSNGVSEKEFNDIINDIVVSFNPISQSDLLASSIRQIYYNWDDPRNETVRALSLKRLLNDWVVLNPVYELLRLWVSQEGNAKVFVYVFDDTRCINATPQASVASLSEFIWGQPFEESSTNSFARNLSENVIYYWGQFARKGDPNSDLSPFPVWSKFDFTGERYMKIGANILPAAMHHYRASQTAFWSGYLPRLLAVVGVEEDVPEVLLWDLTPTEVALLLRLFLALIVISIGFAIISLSACWGFRNALKRQELITQRWMFKAQVYENSHMANVRNDNSNGRGFHRLNMATNHVNVFNVADSSDEEFAPSFDSLDPPDYQAHLNTLDENTFL